jgi:hypothetical protein
MDTERTTPDKHDHPLHTRTADELAALRAQVIENMRVTVANAKLQDDRR